MSFCSIYYLPMRNWNNIFCLSALQNPKIYYLPMRNWNLAVIDRVSSNSNRIYYLPMRNWNHGCEWNFHDSNFIYYLPMRNWNALWPVSNIAIFVFTTYLWGIETHHLDWIRIVNFQFTTYLWGIETLENY